MKQLKRMTSITLKLAFATLCVLIFTVAVLANIKTPYYSSTPGSVKPIVLDTSSTNYDETGRFHFTTVHNNTLNGLEYVLSPLLFPEADLNRQEDRSEKEVPVVDASDMYNTPDGQPVRTVREGDFNIEQSKWLAWLNATEALNQEIKTEQLLVETVRGETPARSSLLQTGDAITHVNGISVFEPELKVNTVEPAHDNRLKNRSTMTDELVESTEIYERRKLTVTIPSGTPGELTTTIEVGNKGSKLVEVSRTMSASPLCKTCDEKPSFIVRTLDNLLIVEPRTLSQKNHNRTLEYVYDIVNQPSEEQLTSMLDEALWGEENRRNLTEPNRNVTLTIERLGETLEVTLNLDDFTDDYLRERRSWLGATITTTSTVSSPAVIINTGEVEGPSAGLIMTLAYLEALDNGILSGNNIITGTGTISANGNIGSVGGVDHKVRIANKVSPDVFFVPYGQRDLAIKTAEEINFSGEIVPVKTWQDAALWLCDTGGQDSGWCQNALVERQQETLKSELRTEYYSACSAATEPPSEDGKRSLLIMLRPAELDLEKIADLLEKPPNCT